MTVTHHMPPLTLLADTEKHMNSLGQGPRDLWNPEMESEHHDVLQTRPLSVPNVLIVHFLLFLV